MDKEFRADGYVNVLNKYGTRQDNSTAYRYSGEPHVDDMTLVEMYEGNGLFSTIIDRPAEEAVKHGLDIDFGSEDISKFIEGRLDVLDFEDKFTTAEKWARLYGGAIIVMLVNDGGGLEDPLNMDRATSIEEMMVFERAVVQPDYTTIYTPRLFGSARGRISYGEPEYFQVFSLYGYFRVHRSRCLVFRNGKVPEQTTNTNYRYWGIPEYVKIRNALRECVTSHGYGVKLLEKSSQAVYSVKNLANLLSTDSGEGQVLTRLEAIDMARSMMNTIAIDADGETYEFKTMTMSGAKELIDTTCNMLSAVSQIPQTILFGRSPAGENSTGESDLENYYNMVENIQKQNMKRNCRVLLDIIIKQGLASGEIQEKPDYKVEFAKLWSMNDTEQASLEQQKAQTQYTKAQTAQLYIDAQVIDPSEVRASLEESDEFDLDDISNMRSMADDFDDDVDLAAAIDMEEERQTEKGETGAPELELAQAIDMESSETTDKDAKKDDPELEIAQAIEINEKDTTDQQEDIAEGCGLLIIKNGMILVGDRTDGDGVCGPGGHLKKGERPVDGAYREAREEFGIIPEQILLLGDYKPGKGKYEASTLFLTDSYSGEIRSQDGEMTNLRFEEPEKLLNEKLFPPFKASLSVLMDKLTQRQNADGGPGSGNFGHSGRPGKVGGSGEGPGRSKNSSEYEKRLADEKAQLLAQKPNKQALTLYKSRFLSLDEARLLTKGGEDLSKAIDDYYELLKKNGNATPEKPISKNETMAIARDVMSGKYEDYNTAREAYIKNWTGMNDEEAHQTRKQLETWFGGGWSRADTKTIDKYIEKDHAYEGETYRGLHFYQESDYKEFMGDLKVGDVIHNKDGMNSSWSTSFETARNFSHGVSGDCDSVTIHCMKNRTSAPVAHLSSQGEDEVLSHSKAQWTVLSYNISDKPSGRKDVTINVIEKGEYTDE